MRYWAIISLIFVFVGCTKDNIVQKTPNEVLSEYLRLPEKPLNYAARTVPVYLQTAQYQNIDNTPTNNPVTNQGATLGRVLFYDKNLSRNKSVSCASCHKQNHGFSDDAVLSEGFEGGKTNRHSMGLINAKYYNSGRFFWDERAATLEDQVLMPIQDPIEMGMTLADLKERLKTLPYYPILFSQAFGTAEITDEKIALALAQFVRSIVSYNTKYDEGRKQVTNDLLPFPNFTEEENFGKELFSENRFKCSACHGGEAYISTVTTSNGLDATTTDAGVGGETNVAGQMGTFKAPSFKDILARAPYMHDGRFATIEEVLDHYSTGIKGHPNLDQQLKDFTTGEPVKFDMTPSEKKALIAFFGTLKDTVIATDERWSNPFK